MQKIKFPKGRLVVVAVAATLATRLTQAASNDAPMKIAPEKLAQLARDYRAAGLALPPAGAVPVRIELAQGRNDHDNWISTCLLGFRLGPGTYLVGTEIETGFTDDPPGSPSDAVDPDQPLTVELADAATVAKRFPATSYPVNRWLAVAVQCEVQKFHALAREIFARGLARDLSQDEWDRFVQDNAWPDPSAIHAITAQARASDGGDPQISLAATAWNHWVNTTIQPGTDRRQALLHLEALARDFPVLAGASQGEFLAALRQTLQPGKGTAGSAEALIDGLTDLLDDEPESFGKRREDFADYVHLSRLGFPAIPALIAHMDDPRLTRLLRMAPADAPFMRAFLKKQGFGRINTGPETMTRVGDLISPLVYALMGPASTRRKLLEDGATRQDLKKEAEGWWVEASKMGEEEYVAGRVLPIEGVQRGISESYLRIVGARYPQQLGGIYLGMQMKPRKPGDEVIVKAIVTNPSLSKDEKLRLLHFGAEGPDLWRREDAIVGLLEIDLPDGEARLVKELDWLPVTTELPDQNSPVVQIAAIMRRTGSPAVWEAFERAAKRADVALRVSLLSTVNNSVSESGTPERTQARIKLLAAFLDDETVRTMPPGLPSPGQGPPRFTPDRPVGLFDYLSFSVGDFVANELPGLLTIIGEPREDFDETDWARYRNIVRTAIRNRAESQSKGLYPPDRD